MQKFLMPQTGSVEGILKRIKKFWRQDDVPFHIVNKQSTVCACCQVPCDFWVVRGEERSGPLVTVSGAQDVPPIVPDGCLGALVNFLCGCEFAKHRPCNNFCHLLVAASRFLLSEGKIHDSTIVFKWRNCLQSTSDSNPSPSSLQKNLNVTTKTISNRIYVSSWKELSASSCHRNVSMLDSCSLRGIWFPEISQPIETSFLLQKTLTCSESIGFFSLFKA